MTGVINQHLEQKPVQLCFRQRVSAFLVQRVLGGEHHVGFVQGKGLAFDGDLPFLHHFQ